MSWKGIAISGALLISLLMGSSQMVMGKQTMAARKYENTAANTDDVKKDSSEADFQGVTIKFDYIRSETPASNQIAVWIEDEEKNLIKTIYVSKFTVNGGYNRREDTLSHWIGTVDLDDIEQEEIDAFCGATPYSGRTAFFWDGTDQDGEPVSEGQYTVKLEGTLYWSSNVLFEGIVDTENPTGEITVTEIYSEDDETNRDMITKVEMTYTEQK